MSKLRHLNEWDIFDAGNKAALNSWMKKGPKKSYTIKVEEPFIFKTDDSEEFHKMKFLLMLANAKYTADILEPSVVPGMMVKEEVNPLRSLSFDSDEIKRHMKAWDDDFIKYKIWKESGGVTYVEFATEEDFRDARETSQQLLNLDRCERGKDGSIDMAGLGTAACRRIRPTDGMERHTNENILPRPYKKVKCLECGEEVCDNLNYKIGHLYNKHNCKPSVGDYKAKQMLTKYFPMGIKESITNNQYYDEVVELLKKHKIFPQEKSPWIYFKTDNNIDGNIKVIENKINIIYWINDVKHQENNISIKELDQILFNFS